MPQSGSTSFIALYAVAMKNSGMKETMMIVGWDPDTVDEHEEPEVAARL